MNVVSLILFVVLIVGSHYYKAAATVLGALTVYSMVKHVLFERGLKLEEMDAR